MLQDNITGFQHLGLPVSDIEKSKAFYALFGFTEVMYKELPANGETVKVAMLELNGFMLELYQLVDQELEEIKSRTQGHIDHFALDVKDINSAFETIQKAGIETLENAPVFLPFWEKGVYYFNILGPDSERVEFNQKIV
jgi:lactoylglutathione lyase